LERRQVARLVVADVGGFVVVVIVVVEAGKCVVDSAFALQNGFIVLLLALIILRDIRAKMAKYLFAPS
jgi:hypothetical protein